MRWIAGLRIQTRTFAARTTRIRTVRVLLRTRTTITLPVLFRIKIASASVQHTLSFVMIRIIFVDIIITTIVAVIHSTIAVCQMCRTDSGRYQTNAAGRLTILLTTTTVRMMTVRFNRMIRTLGGTYVQLIVVIAIVVQLK